MVAKASIIEIYARADAAGKVDIICKNYSNFIGIVDGYTEGLRYMIESEKAYNRKKNHGDLGVRVQTRLLPVIFQEMYWKVLTVAKNIGRMHTRFAE